MFCGKRVGRMLLFEKDDLGVVDLIVLIGILVELVTLIGTDRGRISHKEVCGLKF